MTTTTPDEPSEDGHPAGWYVHDDGTNHITGKVSTALTGARIDIGGGARSFQAAPDFDIETLVVTADGEPTEEIRALLAEAGFAIVPVEPAPPVLAELQQLEVVVPLKAAAERRVDEDVVVWIPGGMQIDGRLVAVNDDDTITVRDAKREYDIALASIAALEGSK